MKLLIVNPVLYTCETSKVKRQDSIKDTMIFGLCQNFAKCGNDVTLYACDDFRPLFQDKCDFKIVYDKPFLKNIFHSNNFPVLLGLKKYLKTHIFDCIICSEVFSYSTLICSRLFPKKTIVWQELANYQKKFHQIPARIWYKHIFKKSFKNVLIVPRSERAKKFISQFSYKISDEIIDHGVDSSLFIPQKKKENQFIVVGQLIERKQVNKIINAFFDFCAKVNQSYVLKIAGEGILMESLVKQVNSSTFKNNVVFLGKITHDKLAVEIGKSKAMLVYTKQDDNMVSIPEALACATPVITTEVPFSSDYIKEEHLGISDANWDWATLKYLIDNFPFFLNSCLNMCEMFSYQTKVKQFNVIINSIINGDNL
jgi:1,2-diacylglycerol 3-alpha-glucosyltransferase